DINEMMAPQAPEAPEPVIAESSDINEMMAPQAPEAPEPVITESSDINEMMAPQAPEAPEPVIAESSDINEMMAPEAPPSPQAVTEQEAQYAATPSQSMGMPSVSCPERFNDVEIPKTGKLCQIFAADFPATMVFHVTQPPQEVVQFYQNTQAYGASTAVKKRFMLQSDDKNTTIIISADGEGSQVDVLVKSSSVG
ncbi:hypothetical protein KJ365_16560, partial [Glaciecola sp. XM2]|uniref:hypothetical protein n=1 Tax=Glaciecola sp. XM2 TaxID=1914931 RepID=UPI001BDF04C8